MVAHVVGLRCLGGEAIQDVSVVEGTVPCGNKLGAEFVAGHPVFALGVVGAHFAVHGPGVVFSPETDEASGQITHARVAVILFAQCLDEVKHHFLNTGVVVVGRK